MAYEHYPASWEAKESSEVFFSENEMPTAENNHSLCKVRELSHKQIKFITFTIQKNKWKG